ncbi:class I SAM-dependent methyltransferase [Streptomyces sp. NPDC046821]|uniref:class I SAM-dependent methyltransferase n=1 Tax=Streptomyces sp. NPDC046821 TaxID=3154702 RepID=UPI0033DB656B
MSDEWEWDETLFAGAASYYRRGRLPYASELADVLAQMLELDGRGRLVDVGCGPGTLALGLAHLFREVVGVDPDGGMIAEATRDAAAQGVAGKTSWVQARAEELPGGLETFDIATFGQSFHWMDRDRVAVAIRDMLRPGGALVHVTDLSSPSPAKGELPYPGVPDAALGALVKRWLGPVRRAGQGVLPDGTRGGEAEVYRRAGFFGPEHRVIAGGQALERTVDDVVAGVFSKSFSAPHLFGDQRDAFEAELRGLLWAASPVGLFSVVHPDTEVFVWWKDPR